MSAYDFIDTLAVQILTYKKEHNETATQFAKGCGVSAATIRRIENGDANVKLSTADKLLRYMNITLIDLLPPLANIKLACVLSNIALAFFRTLKAKAFLLRLSRGSNSPR